MYLVMVLRDKPSLELIWRLLTPWLYNLKICFTFRISICLLAMVFFTKKDIWLLTNRINFLVVHFDPAKVVHFNPAKVVHFNPAKVVHFHPARVVYYDRFLHFI